MTMHRLFEAGALAAALLLGTAAFAADEGKTTGPAAGTNVAPTQGSATAGNPGEPGLPGNKSGPAVTPERKASAAPGPTNEPMGNEPMRGDAKAGNPGQPGMPGNKNGPAVTPPSKSRY